MRIPASPSLAWTTGQRSSLVSAGANGKQTVVTEAVSGLVESPGWSGFALRHPVADDVALGFHRG